MSDWKIQFKRVMVDALVTGGRFINDRPSIYGWQHYDWEGGQESNADRRRKINTAGIDYAATTYVESDWYEFAGTFAPEDDHKYGVDLEVVLMDGTTYQMRYSGTLSDLISAVLKD